MTENELLYVKCVAEEKSLSKAAQKLGLTQPTLSKCLQRIEAALGTKLFKRTSAGLLLTFAGERYYHVAAEILRIYSDLAIELSDINDLKKGAISVGCTMYLTTYLLPLVLPSFKKQCPNIEVNIIEENSTDLERALSSGSIDFAIMHMEPFREKSVVHQNIVFHPLLDDPFLLVTRPEHPLGAFSVKDHSGEFPRIDLTRFANEPFIMVKRGQRIRQVSELILQRAGINPPITLTTKSYETARRLASQGIGVTFVPLQYLRIFVDTYRTAIYRVDDRYSPYWTLCVALPHKAYVSKAAQVFIRMVCEAIDAPPPPLSDRTRTLSIGEK